MSNTQTPLKRAIQIAGSQSELARRIGVTQQSISVWVSKKQGRVPASAAIAIESVTGVSRSLLRPDLFGETNEAA